jgi:ABC-type Na+ efflux pump permease subunit
LNERLLGFILCASSILLILFQTWAMFFAPQSVTDPIFLKPLSWWSIALPVYIIVLFFFGILIWIGWAMVTTPENPQSTSKRDEDKSSNRKLDC